jgi:hypothetical protein
MIIRADPHMICMECGSIDIFMDEDIPYCSWCANDTNIQTTERVVGLLKKIKDNIDDDTNYCMDLLIGFFEPQKEN